ncbi:response regulator transcription factor [Erythrobacter donghaensis]|uniref:response regulator transcription factor n=1 Tax=Erythrobacter donghaensis TaxID=267135 RepID=UPI001FE7F12D|nr:response regulator [Erythrobacter donghaensis]
MSILAKRPFGIAVILPKLQAQCFQKINHSPVAKSAITEVALAKILIADDDVILTEMLRFRLEGARHEVITAADGLEALDKAKEGRPDLIILDSMMPVIAGPEVLARLRANPQSAATPVVMLTARNGEGDIVAALRGGANEYLTKPFIPQELMVRIEKLLLSSL